MSVPFRPDAAAQAAVREALGLVPERTDHPEHLSRKMRDRREGETPPPPAAPAPSAPPLPSLPADAADAQGPAVPEAGRTTPPDGEAATPIDASPELFQSSRRRPKYPA